MNRSKAARTALAVTFAVLVAGCGSEQPTAVVTSPGTDAPAACPPPDAAADGDRRAMIDWVDFVRLDGRMYNRYGDSFSGTVDASLVGPLQGRVLCTISDVVSDPDFEVRDGDASFLPAGTDLHSFSDADPALRLAAQVDGSWRVYEAMDVPRPHTGADLLDVSGATSVELRDADTARRVLASVDDRESVRRLVAAVLAAPVLASPPDDLGSPVFVRFVLADGTWVQRPWNREGGVLAQQIEAPEVMAQLFPPG